MRGTMVRRILAAAAAVTMLLAGGCAKKSGEGAGGLLEGILSPGGKKELRYDSEGCFVIRRNNYEAVQNPEGYWVILYNAEKTEGIDPISAKKAVKLHSYTGESAAFLFYGLNGGEDNALYAADSGKVSLVSGNVRDFTLSGNGEILYYVTEQAELRSYDVKKKQDDHVDDAATAWRVEKPTGTAWHWLTASPTGDTVLYLSKAKDGSGIRGVANKGGDVVDLWDPDEMYPVSCSDGGSTVYLIGGNSLYCTSMADASEKGAEGAVHLLLGRLNPGFVGHTYRLNADRTEMLVNVFNENGAEKPYAAWLTVGGSEPRKIADMDIEFQYISAFYPCGTIGYTTFIDSLVPLYCDTVALAGASGPSEHVWEGVEHVTFTTDGVMYYDLHSYEAVRKAAPSNRYEAEDLNIPAQYSVVSEKQGLIFSVTSDPRYQMSVSGTDGSLRTSITDFNHSMGYEEAGRMNYGAERLCEFDECFEAINGAYCSLVNDRLFFHTDLYDFNPVLYYIDKNGEAQVVMEGIEEFCSDDWMAMARVDGVWYVTTDGARLSPVE